MPLVEVRGCRPVFTPTIERRSCTSTNPYLSLTHRPVWSGPRCRCLLDCRKAISRKESHERSPHCEDSPLQLVRFCGLVSVDVYCVNIQRIPHMLLARMKRSTMHDRTTTMQLQYQFVNEKLLQLSFMHSRKTTQSIDKHYHPVEEHQMRYGSMHRSFWECSSVRVLKNCFLRTEQRWHNRCV